MQGFFVKLNCFCILFNTLATAVKMCYNKARLGDSMIKKLSVHITDCTNPYTNLALEKVLFDNVSDDEMILYLWQNKNTVVIGRNQNPWSECKCSLLESEGGHLARRLSGGGAVFHDLGNLNFTFICTAQNYSLQKNLEVISGACKMAGIETEISGRNDILAEGRKFSGNAFYNSNGKSYHHGTILINTDSEKLGRYLTPPKAKLEAKGVKSVRSRVINLCELNPDLTCELMKGHMSDSFEKVYGLSAHVKKSVNSDEIAKLAAKYQSWDYLYGAQPPFTFECEKRFEWGNIDLKLNVVKGIIKEIKVYTDSMDYTLSERVQTALVNCHFETKKIKEALALKIDSDKTQCIADLIKETL